MFSALPKQSPPEYRTGKWWLTYFTVVRWIPYGFDSNSFLSMPFTGVQAGKFIGPISDFSVADWFEFMAGRAGCMPWTEPKSILDLFLTSPWACHVKKRLCRLALAKTICFSVAKRQRMFQGERDMCVGYNLDSIGQPNQSCFCISSN